MDGGNRGRAARIEAVSAASWCSYWAWERAAVLDSAHLSEKSSISQLGCCSSGELRNQSVEEEEGQTSVAFIKNAISPVIAGLQRRLQGWRFWRGELAAVAPKNYPSNSHLSLHVMCYKWPQLSSTETQQS